MCVGEGAYWWSCSVSCVSRGLVVMAGQCVWEEVQGKQGLWVVRSLGGLGLAHSYVCDSLHVGPRVQTI